MAVPGRDVHADAEAAASVTASTTEQIIEHWEIEGRGWLWMAYWVVLKPDGTRAWHRIQRYREHWWEYSSSYRDEPITIGRA